MFVVLFEVQPKPEQWEGYLDHARLLRPELERIDGFIDNTRFRSLRRPGWVLSLSTWRDEKALVRWRTHAGHHATQGEGRFEIFAGYRLRVAQVTADTHPPQGATLRELRFDETETDAAKAVSVSEMPGAEMPRTEVAGTEMAGAELRGGAEVDDPAAVARAMGWRADADGMLGWDVFEAILTRGAFALMTEWRAQACATPPGLPQAPRRRVLRVIRAYGMTDRREAPQYFPDVTPG